MANGYQVSGSNRRFFDELENEDVDDFTFMSNPQHGSSGYVFGDKHNDPEEMNSQAKKQQRLMEEIERIQRRTLESSERSLGMIHESEQVGITTAEDLLHQREQLENCEDKVSNINRSLRTTQKHINSIKSVFYGFRGMFSKTPPSPTAQPPAAEDPPKRPSSGGLAQSIEQHKSQATYTTPEHPALKLREVDYMNNSSPSPLYTNQDIERKLGDNLDDISLGIERLKGLAIGLGEEIQDQNVMLDRLTSGVDKAEGTVRRQTKEMEKQLKR